MEQQKNEVLPGTLNLMVLKTLSTLEPLQANRADQGNHLQLNQGPIYLSRYCTSSKWLDQLKMGCVGKQPARQDSWRRGPKS
jgi:hypothetical protein